MKLVTLMVQISLLLPQGLRDRDVRQKRMTISIMEERAMRKAIK
jgi:hypothetical protein